MTLEDFIHLCGTTPPTDSDSARRSADRDYAKAYQLIRNKLQGDATLLFKKFNLLQKKLAIWSIKNNSNHNHYLRVLNCLSESVRGYTSENEGLGEEPNWSEAISLAVQHRHAFHWFDSQAPTDFNDQIYEFALAYANLEKYGVQFTERDHELYISEESFELIDTKIHEHCKLIGGKNLLKTVFHYLSPEYKSGPGRFVGLRQILVNKQATKANVPYGYLLAIGARHLGDKGKKEHNDEFLSLLMLCRDLTTIFEIQIYSQWETLYLPPHKFIRFLQESVWYDNLISFSQIKSQHAKLILTRLSKSFIERNLRSNELQLRDIHRVANSLIDLAKDKVASSANIRTIARHSKIQEYLVEKIMKEFLSFQPGEVNTTLEFPPVSDDIDYYFKPAVAMNGEYYLYPKSLCSLGALNSVLNVISAPNKQRSQQNDILLGYEVEDFLREQFRKKNIKIAYGAKKDKNGADEFECDLLVETDKTLFIFEIKKKGLTRKAMSGDEVSLLSDLADSLMFSHKQAMNIEYQLKTNTSLELIHKDEHSTVTLGERRIKRISVSLNDFGALQDKISLQKILLHATDTTLNHPEEKIDKELKKWREYTTEIRRLAIINGEYDGKGHPFHDSFFMSIPQIMTILSHSENCDEFESDMLLLNSMTLGTRNFYREYFHGQKIRNGAKALQKAKEPQ
ncbi:hypothetical protein [Pseudomonas brassicacearum]|uniref:NERD domain-containing protein n=1 Tax=Pseudomonas brassicacearum TaxID=930166 RepID=A0A423JVU8_9PSED|nr:hypothetical protein [Pseudomonas brassicacearum]RON41812.1 hypothetical protein BK664_04470 [Pseudomonas brassicacearum]